MSHLSHLSALVMRITVKGEQKMVRGGQLDNELASFFWVKGGGWGGWGERKRGFGVI